MKAISIRQPWASLIIHDGKDIENRKWKTAYRGPLLIHASKWWSTVAVERILRSMPVSTAWRLADLAALRGKIIGIVDLVDCVTDSDSRWFEGPVGLVLRNARPVEPYEVKGALGLFNAPEPKELTDGS